MLKRLLDLIVVRSEEGKNVRQAMFEAKAIHFILACLAIFTHQTCDPCLVPSLQHEVRFGHLTRLGLRFLSRNLLPLSVLSARFGRNESTRRVSWEIG